MPSRKPWYRWWKLGAIATITACIMLMPLSAIRVFIAARESHWVEAGVWLSALLLSIPLLLIWLRNLEDIYTLEEEREGTEC